MEAGGGGRDLKRSSAGAHARAVAAPGAGADDAYSKRACSGWTIGAGACVGGGELALPASFVAWTDVAGIDSPGASAQTAASMPTSPGVRHVATGVYVSYCIQKLGVGRANHALFWVQEATGRSTLAVVGTDARLSGHFTYSTVPGFPAPPLRCTNRGEVVAWLASIGVVESLSESSVALPALEAEERRRLLTGEPVWARPDLQGTWVDVREESGRVSDGRHYKRFWLVSPEGCERLAVAGLDSARRDRRYKYAAVPSLGGFAFENSREVLDWLTFVLDRPADNPVQPRQMRAAQPLSESALADFPSAKPAGHSSLSVRTDRRAGSPAPEARTPPSVLRRMQQEPGAGLPSLAQQLQQAEQQRVQQYWQQQQQWQAQSQQQQPASGGKVRPSYSGKVRPGSSALGHPDEPDASSWLFGNPGGAAAAGPGGGSRRSLSFRCGSCGALDHGGSDCPAMCLSPHSLISPVDPFALAFHPTLDDPAMSSCLPTPLARALTPGGGSGEHADSAATAGLAPAPAAFMAQPQAITPGAKAAFEPYPALMGWVAAVPTDHTEEQFRAWAHTLGGQISDMPPPPPASEDDVPLGGLRWVPTQEALAILQELSRSKVSLPLLQATHISRAVAMLRTHRIRDVADAAAAIVARWRSCAVAALEQANMALATTA